MGTISIENLLLARKLAGGSGDNVELKEKEYIEKQFSSYATSTLSSVGHYAFTHCQNLTSVNFTNCVSIDSFAFNICKSLETALFPKCEFIGRAAFTSCETLSTISFPECTMVSSNAFMSCYSLSYVNLPKCEMIKYAAFTRCYSLNTVSLPNCTKIESSVFNRCYNLLSLYLLGSSVCTLVNANAFGSTPIAGYTTSTGGIRGSIFVLSSLYNAYISATNWATYSARFVSVSNV